ncbi:Glucosyl-3-phosphoglycerate synthase [bacterium HR36]|nr:Glucosyl-3-phosphoglycerate synthase [bacterium HR36]
MISVIIPALNEAASIQEVVQFARRHPLVTEVLVVDDGSIDGTPQLAQQAGARVISSTLLGKGASMEDGLWAAQNEVVVYLDGDLQGLAEDLIERMSLPVREGRADFVKAKFTRAAGRVTVLTARPLIRTFFPELAHIEQPLAGIIAARRSFLRNLRFETDYGVDVGLLIDAAAAGARIEQVDIGHIQHDSQSLEVLGDMASQVVRVILERAARYGRLASGQLQEVEEVERRTQSELAIICQRLGKVQRLALFDLDGTLVRGRFIVALAQRYNKSDQLANYLDNPELSSEERTRRIAQLFAGLSKKDLEELARALPLQPGAAECVVALKRLGFRVGIITDSFFLVAETIRRRVFADFSIAHVLRFRQGILTGEVHLCQAMFHPHGCTAHSLCKANALLHLSEQFQLPPSQILAVGDTDADACMLRLAGLGVAFQPKSETLRQAAKFAIENSLDELVPLVEAHLFGVG